MNNLQNKYSGQDIAFLIPTKDRPEKLNNLLQSLVQQNIDFCQIIVVASGKNIEDVVMNFSNQLPVEYHHSKQPGQIRQRNIGIQLLNEKVKLVACIDDDIVFLPDSINIMIDFWNQTPEATAGVGFNVVNEKVHQHTLLKGILRLSVPDQGRVLPSGLVTSICNIEKNIKSQWLNGGATVWKIEFLKQYRHKEINAKWATCEDLIFSYPIGKKYPLYVCADAHVRHEHIFNSDISGNIYRYRGRTNILWQLFFVHSNDSLSISSYIWVTLITSLTGLFRAWFQPETKETLSIFLGRIEGAIIGLKTIVKKEDLTLILSDQNTLITNKIKKATYHYPTNLQMVIFILKIIKNFIQKASHHLFYKEYWNIGIVDQKIQNFLGKESSSEISWMSLNRKNKYIADPFGINYKDKYYIFYEDYDYKTKQGIISFIEWNDQLDLSSQPVVSRPFHLSYPYLLEYEGEIYCIPEAFQTNEIAIYKATDFPSQWEKVHVLIPEITGIDPTILYYEKYWYLFCTLDGEYGAVNDELHIYYADDLFSDWKPHLLNPVKIDARSARPGGTPFFHKNLLYRPAQDCSETYGGKVTINQVTSLSPNKFSEINSHVIPPQHSKYPEGIHTLSKIGDKTLIDGKRFKFQIDIQEVVSELTSRITTKK